MMYKHYMKLTSLWLITLLASTACSLSPELPEITIITVKEAATPLPGLRKVNIKGRVQGTLPATVEVENLPYQTKTDLQGNFTLTQIPTEAEFLHVFSTQSDGKRQAVRVPIIASSPEIDLSSLVLANVGSIVGKVNGSGDLTGTSVFIPGTSFGAHCDAEGNFFLPHIPAGQYTLAALQAGFVPSYSQVQVKSGEAAASLIELKTERRSGLTLSGQILSENKPLAGALLAISGESFVSFSDTLGKFKITSVPAGNYKLLIRREGFVPVEQALDLKQDQTITVHLTSNSQDGSIEGQVLDQTGRPIVDADIQTQPGSQVTRSDPSGRFQLRVPPGAYFLQAHQSGKTVASGFVSVDAAQKVEFKLQGVLSVSSLLCQQQNENQINIHAPGSQVTVNVENTNQCMIAR